MATPDFTIRDLRSSDSLEDLTELIHQAYRQLKDMGFRYVATWQPAEKTQQRLSQGNAFIAECNNRIIGTITIKFPQNTHGCPWYDRSDVTSFGQFAVDPAHQRNGIGGALIQCAEQQAKAFGCHELALDTAEGAEQLIRMYKKRGYRFIEYADWDVTNYHSVILSKTL